ncbi:MAG TPA: hypothetical protein VJG13_12765 [Thermoanaerobaculia bacterium]|nr:hypothetical protein [Thermoanaerobaculia bacterium]
MNARLDVGPNEHLSEELELRRDIHAAESEIADGRDISHDEARRMALEALRSTRTGRT